jgi:hypothetical protein
VAVKWCVCVRLPACRGRSVTVRRGRGLLCPSLVCAQVGFDMTLGGADRGVSSAAALSNPGDYCGLCAASRVA